MPVNWNALMAAPDPGQSFMQAFQGARQQKMQEQVFRQQQAEHQEDRQFRREEMAFRRGERETQQRAAQLTQARDQLQIMTRLLEGVNDPTTYEQARQNAVALGLDVSKVPPTFNPGWVMQTKQQAAALLGTVEQELMAVAPGTAVIDKRTGREVYENPARPRYYSVPPGGMLVPEPGSGGQPTSVAPQPGQVEDGYRFKGGNPADPNSWEPVNGGPTQPASGGFPGD